MEYRTPYNQQGTWRNNREQKKTNENKSETPSPVRVKSFYNNDGKTIQPDLFDGFAKKVAESLIGKNEEGKSINVTSTQLRKIFDEVKRFDQILTLQENQWDKQLPYIKMIKSKVAYAIARASEQENKKKALYKNLKEFISSGIDLIKTEEDYHIFVSLFEAVYGFFYESKNL